jgi:hypothetical protein
MAVAKIDAAGPTTSSITSTGDSMKSQPNPPVLRQRPTSQLGFTVVQVLITVTLIAVVSAFALMAVGNARASMRLTASTRELAGYLEKARTNAVRRNGTSVVTILDANSYRVNMDFDSNGSTETRTILLQSGVTFSSGIGLAVTFDWRGRIGNQMRFELQNNLGTRSSINLSGSGDVTIGSEIFEDSEITDVTLNTDLPPEVADPSGEHPVSTVSPEPIEASTPTPTPTPTPDPAATPTPTPNPDATPTPTPYPTATPTPTPTPVPTVTPTPTPTPLPCTLSAPSTYSVPKNGSPKTLSIVTIANANQTVLTASKSGDITGITPLSTTVSGNGTISYTITFPNGASREGTITISSSCGSKTIHITFD